MINVIKVDKTVGFLPKFLPKELAQRANNFNKFCECNQSKYFCNLKQTVFANEENLTNPNILQGPCRFKQTQFFSGPIFLQSIFNQPPFFRAPEYAAGQHSHVLTSSSICNNLKTKVGLKFEAKNQFLFPRNST